MSDESLQHNMMANAYLVRLSFALSTMYDIPPQDAEDLSWGGLGETENWRKNPNQVRIGEVNRKYRNGEAGKKCDP